MQTFQNPLGYNLISFKTIDSTNEEAKRLIRSGSAISKSLIISNKQSNGYGQKGRSWESLEGNLHLSILLETTKSLQELQELVFLTATAMAKYIEQLLPETPSIKLKWPNDILIEGKKVAGILVETIKNQGKQFVIIGIGVNLNKTPQVNDQPVTSLKKFGNIAIASEEFLSGFIGLFDAEYQKWNNENSFDQIRQEWQNRAHNLNQAVTIDNGNEDVSGTFCGINEHGALILEIENGQKITIDCGKLIS